MLVKIGWLFLMFLLIGSFFSNTIRGFGEWLINATLEFVILLMNFWGMFVQVVELFGRFFVYVCIFSSFFLFVYPLMIKCGFDFGMKDFFLKIHNLYSDKVYVTAMTTIIGSTVAVVHINNLDLNRRRLEKEISMEKK